MSERDTTLADRTDIAYASSLATYGTGAGLVIATGDATEVGRISRLIAEAEDLQTPLTKKIAALSRILLIVILALGAVTFVVGAVLRGGDRGRDVQGGGGRPRRRRHTGGAPGRRDDHPGHRGQPDGSSPGHHPAPPGRRDARQHDRDLLRQDRHADREPDDRAAHGRRGSAVRLRGLGLRAPRRRRSLAGRGRRRGRGGRERRRCGRGRCGRGRRGRRRGRCATGRRRAAGRER